MGPPEGWDQANGGVTGPAWQEDLGQRLGSCTRHISSCLLEAASHQASVIDSQIRHGGRRFLESPAAPGFVIKSLSMGNLLLLCWLNSRSANNLSQVRRLACLHLRKAKASCIRIRK